LRRFIELVIWFIFFSDHPVEWSELERTPEKGTVWSQEKPISFLAHRDFGWYVDYAKERLTDEPSGVTGSEIGILFRSYSEISSVVHAARNAFPPGELSAPFDSIEAAKLQRIQVSQRDIFRAGCICVVAVKPSLLTKLEAVERGWFDWLLGRSTARTIRSAPFGVR
jgi:hypothetical protein